MKRSIWLFSYSLSLLMLVSGGSYAARAADSADAALTAPPGGVTPANVRLADILALHEKAIGALKSGIKDSVTEKWTFNDSGIAGTEQLDRSGTNYRSRIVRGPFSEEHGQFNGKRWHYDYNGLSSPTTWLDNQSFYVTRVLEDASDPKNDVTVLGITSGDAPAYVLQIKIPGFTNPEWVFYDKKTGLVTRVEDVFGKHRFVNTYDDYRTVDGLTLPWHMHDSDGRPELDDDWHMVSLKHGVTFTDSAFQAPPTQSSLGDATVSGTIPLNLPEEDTGDATISHGDDPIVRVTIGNRGLDFLIDSGSPGSVVDWEVAREIGLPTFNQVTQLSNGKHIGYETKLLSASLGPIPLSNFSLYVQDFDYAPADGTKVVGVLGADFLSTHYFKLDYVNHLFEIIAAKDFATAIGAGSSSIPVTLDDSVPYLSMRIANDNTERVMFNNSQFLSIVFGQYVRAHQDNFSDLTKGDHQTCDLPYSNGDSYGLKADVWIARTPGFQFGNYSYENQPLIATDTPFETSYNSTDAVLGYDILGYFDIYFALPDNMIYLKPNKWFHEHFKVH